MNTEDIFGIFDSLLTGSSHWDRQIRERHRGINV